MFNIRTEVRKIANYTNKNFVIITSLFINFFKRTNIDQKINQSLFTAESWISLFRRQSLLLRNRIDHVQTWIEAKSMNIFRNFVFHKTIFKAHDEHWSSRYHLWHKWQRIYFLFLFLMWKWKDFFFWLAMWLFIDETDFMNRQ
jgi:hypothetical protein